MEIPLYRPRGEGGHTFVELEKRLLTTEEAARALARAAGVLPRDVGYAGRKDRHAVTRQWFSVPGWPPEEAARLELPGLRVLGAARHPHKLRTGQLRGNRFTLRLRGLDASALRPLAEALGAIRAEGLPNRYGLQRFGRDGGNAERGREILLGAPLRRSARGREARFLVSSLQAAVFNEVLARRARPLARLESGDLAVKHASGGVFLVEDAGGEQPRADAFEISPTGPIPGSRMARAQGEPGRREEEVLRALGLPPDAFARPPRGMRLRGARRPLRVPVEEADVADAEGTPLLRFCLPRGSFATVLLEELAARCGFALPGSGTRSEGASGAQASDDSL